jgi:alanine racemase
MPTQKTKLKSLNTIYISREAILNNFDLFRKLNPDFKIFPVLKSNAYGHGIKEIATILKEREIDYIAVNDYTETLEIRSVNKSSVLII